MFSLDEVSGFAQPFVLQPVTGWSTECFQKIAFESGQAAAGELREFFNGNIVVKVTKHELFQVDLVRDGKVE